MDISVTTFVVVTKSTKICTTAVVSLGRSFFDTRSTFTPSDRLAQPISEVGDGSPTEVKIKFVTQ